jgi:hypothetical protein
MTSVVPCERCDDTGGGSARLTTIGLGTAARRRVRAHAARQARRARAAIETIRHGRSRASTLKRADCLAPGVRDLYAHLERDLVRVDEQGLG